MANENEQTNGEGLPPRLNLRKLGILRSAPNMPGQPDEAAKAPEAATPAQSAAPQPPAAPAARPAVQAGGPQTVRLAKPAIPAAPRPATIVAPAAAAPGKPEMKSKTSRIPLEDATAVPPPEGGVTPKTIRIKPIPMTDKTSGLAGLGKLAPEQPAAAQAPTPATAAKRKTSRVSLESALAAEQQQPEPPPSSETDAGGPKTIRLKRPTDGATVKVTQDAQPTVDAAAGAETKPALGKTARLDEVPPEEEGATPTRRKTIRVKRPTIQTTVPVGGGVPIGQISRVQEEAAPEEGAPHWTFAMLTGVAMLVLVVTIWMFMAQVYGVNVSLTKTSYGAPGLDLPWPGKIPPMR